MRPFISLSVLSALLTTACGGGGDSGGSQPGPAAPNFAGPGQFITVYSPVIRSGETATVTFRGDNNYEVTIPVTETADGSLRVAVPAFVDTQTASITQGTLSILVNGQDAGSSILVGELPDVGNLQSGQVVIALFQAIKTQLENARDRLGTAQVNSGADVSAVLTGIQAKIDTLASYIDEVSTNRTLTVRRDGNVIVLSEQDLLTLDRWVYAVISGIENELIAKGLSPAPASFLTSKEQVINPQASIDFVMNATQGGINWSNVLWMGVGAVVATGGLIMGGAAALVAVPAGLAIAITSACWDIGASAAFNRMLEGLDTAGVEAYDLGQKLWDHAVDIGLQGWSSTEHWTAEMYDDISTWVSSIDLADKLAEVKCRLAPAGQAAGMKGASSQKQAGSVADFCAAFDQSAPPAEGRVVASVSIPDAGYSTMFIGRHVHAILFHVQNVYEDTYYPQITAKSNPPGYVNPSGGMPLEDTITIAMGPALSCSRDYALQGSIEDGATVSFSTNRFTPDPKFGSYMTVNGTMTLIRFGSGVGSRLRGSFKGDLYSKYTIQTYTSPVTVLERWGSISGSFDVVIEDLSQSAAVPLRQ